MHTVYQTIALSALFEMVASKTYLGQANGTKSNISNGLPVVDLWSPAAPMVIFFLVDMGSTAVTKELRPQFP
jgi:hypothetical protein